jgi:hypothetical protein
MSDFNNKKSMQSGFIRFGSILLVLIILIVLRVYWGIDISEPANEVFQKLNSFTGKLIYETKELFYTVKNLFLS